MVIAPKDLARARLELGRDDRVDAHRDSALTRSRLESGIGAHTDSARTRLESGREDGVEAKRDSAQAHLESGRDHNICGYGQFMDGRFP